MPRNGDKGVLDGIIYVLESVYGRTLFILSTVTACLPA